MNIAAKDLNFYPTELLDYQLNRYKGVQTTFENSFGYCANAVYSVPGRSEICGNHTDHNLGKAVGASVNLDIIAFVKKRDDNKIVIKSDKYDDVVVDINDLVKKEDEYGSSLSLVKGICSKFIDLDFNVGGFDAFTANDVINGSGLSSSAAFEVLIAYILNDLYNEKKIDSKTLAIISQYAENEYFGKASGLLDQISVSFGGAVAIDFENKENPKVEKIPFDLNKNNYCMIITNTGCSHADLSDDYSAIKQEMQKVANHFGKEYLRQVSFSDFLANIGKLKSIVNERAIVRALHYFNENKNVDFLTSALKTNDFEKFLSVINSSGKSSSRYLQNIYSQKSPESQSVTLALALSEQILNGCGACRVHGGGFGGTIQAFVPNNKIDSYINTMESVFGKNSCFVLKIRNCGPLRIK